jgi:subtilisin family serine protease
MSRLKILYLEPVAVGAAPVGPSPALPKSFSPDPTFSTLLTPPPSAAAVAGTQYVIKRGEVDDSELQQLDQSLQTQHNRQMIFADPKIETMPTCGGDPPLGNDGDVRHLLGVGGLASRGMNGLGVAVAVVDTGINIAHLRGRGLLARLDRHLSWSPDSRFTPGSYAVDHGTMCALDVLQCAPEATLLDFALLRSTGSIPSLLSDAVIGFNRLLSWMSRPLDERAYHSLVVSNSWGIFDDAWDPFPAGHPGRYIDNPNHPFNIIVGSLARAGADIVFAAGNCGAACPDGRCGAANQNKVRGASSHQDVLCVGGVDTADVLVGYSTEGPGMLVHDKPDLVTYTHFLGSEAFGAGSPDSGTSAACPVAAGAVAALRSAYPFDPGLPNRSPANVRDFLRQHCTDGPSAWRSGEGFGRLITTEFANAGTYL